MFSTTFPKKLVRKMRDKGKGKVVLQYDNLIFDSKSGIRILYIISL